MDFRFQEIDNFGVVSVNVKRATFFEASSFNEFLNYYLSQNINNYVVDLSYCDYIDAAFLSNLLHLLRTISLRGGKLRVVKPMVGLDFAFQNLNSVRILDFDDNVESALQTFKGRLKIRVRNENGFNSSTMAPKFL